MPVIDFHAHVIHPAIFAKAGNRSAVSGFGQRRLPAEPRGDDPLSQKFRRMTEPDVQLADMQRRGIDIGVLSTSTIYQSTYSFPAAEAYDMERAANTGIADWVRRFPDHFVGSFSVPIQDVDLSLKTIEEAVGLGLRIANLPAGIDGRYLGERHFWPIWEALAAAKVVAIIHPDGIKDPGFQNYSLWNAIGQAIEETRVMCSLIYEGLFDRVGEVPIVMCHGGGYLPFYIARLDRNATAHPASMQNISRLPSEYLRLFYYDTVTYDHRVVEMLIDRVGEDRILFGTDYPFGDVEPLKMLDLIAPPARNKILYGNAKRLLGPTGAA